MARRHRFTVASVFWCGIVAGAPAVAQTDLSKFPLAKAIPADVFLAVAGRHNSERKFLDDHWARVYRAFHESGIIGDVCELVSDMMSDEQAEQVDALTERFSDLCKSVDWSELVAKEVVFAQRYVTPVAGSPYEGIVLCRLDKEKAATNYKAIKAIMEEVAKLIEARGGKGEVAVTETKSDDFIRAVFGPTSAPTIGIAVGAWKDVLVIGFGGLGLMDDSVNLLRGKGPSKSLVSTDRFKKAFAKLPPAEDSIFFWDMSDMFGKLKGMVGMMTGGQGHEGKHQKKAKPAKKKHQEEDEDADEDKPTKQQSDDEEEDDNGGPPAAFLAMIPKLIDEISIFDYTAKVEWTDGFSVHSESVSALKPDAKSKALYEVLAGPPPIEDFQRLIPKEAKDFSIGTGINWTRLYHAAREFYSANAPGAEKKLAEFDHMQKEEWDLDIEKDVLGLIAGGHVTVEMDSDFVMMIKITDEEKAEKQLDRLFDLIAEKSGKQGGLLITEIEVAGKKGFRQFSHPMMMMMGGMTPVCGCAEGYLIVGSNAKSIRLCLETAKGKHPNITKSERWKKESVMPKGGGIDSISFKDQSGMAAAIQSAIGGFSMAMGMAGMFGQDMPSEAKAFLTKLPPILAKLGPVAGKLDFFQSTGAYCTFENGAWHEREVQNYKGPRPPEEDEEAEAKVEKSEKPAKAKAVKPKKKPKKEEDDE